MPASAEMDIESCCKRVEAEYRELPGLCLTRPQIRRRWNLNAAASEAVVSRLVSNGFLRKTRVGYALSPDILASLEQKALVS
jgi:hypothetical protein